MPKEFDALEVATALCVAQGLFIEGVSTWEVRGEEEVEREAMGDILGAPLFDAEMDALGEEETEALEDVEGVERAVIDMKEDLETERELKGDCDAEAEPMAFVLDARGLLERVESKERVRAAGVFVIPLTLTPKDLVGLSWVAVATPVLEAMEEGVCSSLFVASPDKEARLVEVADNVSAPVEVPL